MASSSQVPVTLSTLKQDSLMIPAARMAQFFPAGHPVSVSGGAPRGLTHQLQQKEKITLDISRKFDIFTSNNLTL